MNEKEITKVYVGIIIAIIAFFVYLMYKDGKEYNKLQKELETSEYRIAELEETIHDIEEEARFALGCDPDDEDYVLLLEGSLDEIRIMCK